jgi:hypothetical protein
MRFWFDHELVMLPKDAVWHVERGSKKGEYRVRIERATGKNADLAAAIQEIALDTTSSKPSVRLPLPDPALKIDLE